MKIELRIRRNPNTSIFVDVDRPPKRKRKDLKWIAEVVGLLVGVSIGLLAMVVF